MKDYFVSAFTRMRQDCYNPKSKKYHIYGAIGVEVKWKSAAEFRRDMGPRPSLQHTIDRIDANGDYCKDNCKWSTLQEQSAVGRRTWSNSTSGITGVSLHRTKARWMAYVQRYNSKLTLYWGPDFFEACCARKSYEVQYVNNSAS